MSIVRRISERCTDLCLHKLCLLLMVFLVSGCATGSFNSDPACKDCKKFLAEAPSADALPPECNEKTPEVDTHKRPSNLVFEGGGVKGVAYVGALEVMAKAELLDAVEQVAGTSAGAITATMVALGLTPKQIRALMIDLDFRKLADGSCFLGNTARLVNRYGWYKGDFFLCFMECLVEKQLKKRDATFQDLQNRIDKPRPGDPNFRELFVIGTDVTTNNTQLFSASTTPHTRIADAVRISMSIPLFFAARETELGPSADGRPAPAVDLFVDGGVLRNYAIDLFDSRDNYGLVEKSFDDQTLGFHLGTLPRERHNTDNLVAFSRQLISTLLNSQVISLCNGSRGRDVRRSVFIDPLGIGTTQFDITLKQKCELANSGAKATADYLNDPHPSSECPQWMMQILRRESAHWFVD